MSDKELAVQSLAEIRAQIDSEEAQAIARMKNYKEIVKGLFTIEVARYENGQILGLRISRDGDTALIFKNLTGIRVGENFAPRIGETITYTEVEL